MDLNLVRSLLTVAAFVVFLCIVWWAYGSARKVRFEHDALLPFSDEHDRQEGAPR